MFWKVKHGIDDIMSCVSFFPVDAFVLTDPDRYVHSFTQVNILCDYVICKYFALDQCHFNESPRSC